MFVRSRAFFSLVCSAPLLAQLSSAAVAPETREVIDRIMQRTGVYNTEEGVHKFVIPREAAVLLTDDEVLSPNLGMNSWVGFASAIHEEALVAGQLLLLEEEVNTVLSTVLVGKLQVTGLAPSFGFDGRRLYALDFTGTGEFRQLATDVRRSLDGIILAGRTATRASHHNTPVALPTKNAIDKDPINGILAMRGTIVGGVYRAAIGRKVLLGAETVGREMGMSTWVSFAGTNDRALTHIDLLATSEELQRVLTAACRVGMNVTSIRNHTLGEHPQLVFVHFWAEGTSVALAKAIRHILEVQVGLSNR
jgi:hypothetical protein